MRLKNILFLIILISHSILAEKFGSYDLAFPNTTSAGTASLGVGLEDASANLYTNPALLSNQNKYVIDGGIGFATNQSKYNAVRPISAGFYIPINDKTGVGVTGKQTFYQNFPGGYDSMINYTFAFFGSYKINENWNASLGIGPSIVFRGGYQSNYSISPMGSISYKNGNHLIGILIQSVGKFREEGYRGADSLRERLPEYTAFGYSYKWGQTTIYSEARKIFWEKSSFHLNGSNSNPNLDRGIGAEIKLSLGATRSILDSNFLVRSGFEVGGFYNDKGQNKRSLALALGASWKLYQTENQESFFLHLAVVNYSIFSKSGGRQPESQLYFSGTYTF